MQASWSETPRLRGVHVSLEPLGEEHVPALAAAVRDGELWRAWYGGVPEPAAMGEYVAQALAMRDAGRALPFAVRDARGDIVGSTRFYDLDPATPRLHVGYTWYAARVQRTGLNTEAKLLLLTHAFEALGCAAVGFKTSWHNHASRAAILRLGAKQDGVLRHHMRHRDGTLRDSVYFSIIDAEWPAVRSHLRHKLELHAHD
ncbi:MAG TPA: GNAT family N-acetyltransferase [Lysobacter sp.]|nr:GNAT family N-acetyltransferase [Lysobacter sp.]